MTLNFLKGPLNQHIELTRLGGFLSLIAGIGYSGAHLFLDHQFSIIEFGTGMGVLLAGVAGGSAVKDTAAAKVAAAQGDSA